MYVKKIRGSTFVETLVALMIILIVINPLFFSVISLKKSINNLDTKTLLENEMEKVRAFYKINNKTEVYVPDNKNFKINVKSRNLTNQLYSIEISINLNNVIRESNLYVYK